MHGDRSHLKEQMDFLRWSGHAYDSGIEHEAKRLSVPIRTLVHDTSMSTGLLTQLGVKDKLGWIDRGPPDPKPGTHMLGFGLCVVRHRLDTGVSAYEPAIKNPAPDRLHPPVSFEDWWQRIILTDQRGNVFSRRDLVLAVANKDGGAHIDSAMSERYRALSRENSLGFVQGPDRPIANSIVLASVRQIAEELLQTIALGLGWSGDQPHVEHPVCALPLDKIENGPPDERCPCGSGRSRRDCSGLRKPLLVMGNLTPGPVPAPDGVDILVREKEQEPPSIVLDSLILEPVRD